MHLHIDETLCPHPSCSVTVNLLWLPNIPISHLIFLFSHYFLLGAGGGGEGRFQEAWAVKGV